MRQIARGKKFSVEGIVGYESFNFEMVFVADSRVAPSRCTACQLDAGRFGKVRGLQGCHFAALVPAAAAADAAVADGAAVAFVSWDLRYLASW